MKSGISPGGIRIHRPLLAMAAAGAVAVLAVAVNRPDAVLPAYRFAFFLVLAPTVGSLLFGLIHATTGGAWGETLRPFLAAGTRLAPWIWLGIIPLVLAAPAGPGPAYDSRTMLAVRAIALEGALGAAAVWLYPRDRRPPAWIGPVGLIGVVFLLHVLAEDWLMRLEPDWHSTAFPVVWMLGQAVTGLGCAIIGALLSGRSPEAQPSTPRAPGLDWGNLLLTAMLLWCYVMFAQFLIIWSGNLPREISWFVRREQGGWGAVPLILAALHFVVPLGLLLSRRAKRTRRGLVAAALVLLVAQALYLAWVILPAFPDASWSGLALRVAAPLAAGSCFFSYYLRLAGRRLESS